MSPAIFTKQFDKLDPEIIGQLGQLGRRYDAGDLRRFVKPNRDALLAFWPTPTGRTVSPARSVKPVG